MKVLKAALALAGVAAVALYVAVMLLIELLARLLPLIVLGAVVMLTVYVWRRVQAYRRERHPQRAAMKNRAHRAGLARAPQPPVPVVSALPSHRHTRVIVGGEGEGSFEGEGYLQLGPPLALPSPAGQSYASASGRSHARRSVSHARPRSSRP
ncbi:MULTISPECIES: hypothetical protein [Mycobacteriaceae]|jgi:hypothetical protein|uniref:hypothetical protein n=1 Tax=Mycobacteriaceae TaxID=1762 RepID=UPI0009A590EC|nr:MULTISPECIES: hypothetical protein [Mycobacteriaceae]SKQ81517.1 Uncharacterised protein [Mycobacteroides abscessus subsp. massiliense]